MPSRPGIRSERLAAQDAFWRGSGPSLILIPPAQQDLYDLDNYPAKFRSPRLMWESEIRRAEPLIGWPTDGLPTVRPNLGVIFVPAMAGLGYRLPEGSMPWPGEPLEREAIRAALGADIRRSETMRLAEEFYAIHRQSGMDEVAAYHADTQGVFDIAHLLNGSAIFYDLADPGQAEWIEELLGISLELYLRATRQLKAFLGEPDRSMIHGHGTSQGVWFTAAGARLAEDTATLLSPAMIDRWILPVLERAAAPFGGVFVHFCGRHPALLERLCALDAVRAIDLGNPEQYDSRWVLERCARTRTVLYSRLAAEAGETWEHYAQRLAGLVRETGARVILRPVVFPRERAECAAMRDLWHEWTQC
ncbi:MAG TPA: hypothetical protein P5555_03545 [Candidatus Paceibacterota bacterium]|nr:hypothetical protein [Verrucomicrobiota bacterium]HOX01508.1 hypothetical protein [Verrucomicrobiota bacterium]HRZ44246.1 hypothetical protein [Candidatus Paceibacterota bacterium]HRZ91882.1 hypothetical protein [Candidatus Paceibacterota bacterium]